ncbi:putative BRCT domain-containing protein [Helianthus annuus]|nr:putative BRCT domain-containing protein [Helianthus annuus]
MGDYDKSDDSDSGTWDFIDEETQIFDSQFCNSPTSSFGNKCGGDTDQFYELPTQVMDPDCETEEVNLGGETQVVNLDTEFEEMDALDNTQIFNDYDTEEVVVSDQEGSEKTEIVEDSELSDEDTCNIEHTQIIHSCNADIKEYNPKTDCRRSEQHTSGVGFKKFTSFRAASMRAAGLAALNNVSKHSKSLSCPSLNSGPDTQHRRILSGKSHPHDLEKINKSNDCLEDRSKRGFGRSTARKLFDEGPTETKDANDNYDLGGLSYIDSQEPGDASQANALDFVDDFLKVNIEGDDSCDVRKSTGGKSNPVLSDVRKSTGGKSKPVLSAKGAQTFAKSANLINGIDKRRIFDWDSKLEDEGGGDFLVKNKELFFASGSRRPKSSISSKVGRKLGKSESKLVLGKNKEKDKLNKSLETVTKESRVRKNLINELDEQSTDIQEKTEAQINTQMAAVATKDLCLGLQATDRDSTKTNAGCKHMQKGYGKGQLPPVSNNGVRITRSRSKMSSDQSKEVMSAKSAARTSENFDCAVSDVVKRTGKVSLKRREVDTVEAPVASVDQMSVKKQCIQHVTPVARRTRQSMRYSESDKDVTILKDKRICQKVSSTRKEIGTQSTSRLTRSKAATLTEQEKVCATPVSRQTPVKEFSPICMGDEYLKQSCRRSFLMQEVCSVSPTESLVETPNKDTRQKSDVTLIHVVFSRHLDGDIIKHQKKILSRLGASESSSMSDATHFIADDFVRTKNMLEAIALGKPVVTHHWLESCGQACRHIDEKSFMLRDAKKEKEFGFSLPTSLAHARQNPLLQGHRVLITPNTKPGKDILSNLVKAVHGVAIERMGRSLWNNAKVPEGLLILSCEEDYAVCLPFLEKGAAIYSSELLLNGIVTQRLEYERHRLFIDHVKRTRSTIWVKKDDSKYKAVGKVK